jgi:hypothetical protein
VYTTRTALPPVLPLVSFTIPGDVLAKGVYGVKVAYSGDEFYSLSSTSLTLRIR